MRVLHVTQASGGGVPRHIHALAAWQAANEVEVGVAGAEDFEHLAGIRYYPWKATRSPVVWPGEVTRLRAILRDFEPEVVHLHSSKAGLVGRLVIRGSLPTILTPHGWSFLMAGPTAPAAKAWERFATRWTTQLIAVSDDERDEVRGFSWPATPVVVPNGVDSGTWKEVSVGAREAAREELGIKPDVPLVVCVGRLVTQKGQLDLVRNWALVQKQNPDAALVLVGDGPMRPQLEAEAGDHVELVGQSDRIATWYAAADVIVQPSHCEGMSYVTLESMAAGQPLVVFDVGGMRQVLGEGNPGLIGAGDIDALCKQISQWLSDRDDGRLWGSRNRQRIEEHFDEPALLARIHAAYRR